MISRPEIRRSDLRPPLLGTVGDVRDAGFTLIEMLVVVAVLGVIGALGIAALRPVSPSVRARFLARDAAAEMRLARAKAVGSNRAQAFMIDLTRHKYGLAPTPAHDIPTGVSLSLLTQRGQTAGSVGQIRFDPDGSSSGGRLTIDGGGRILYVGVDWLSGRVSLAEAH